MIAAVTILGAFPVGYFMRSHLAGFGLVALGRWVRLRRGAEVSVAS